MKKLLFVDDEPMILQGLKAGLYGRRKDWDMHFAVGGASAIQMMQQSHFDVMVTDLRMPGIDGTALVAHAKESFPETIRIVLSGYADEEQSKRLVSLAHRFLSKPCEPKRLEGCIDRCLARQSLVKSETLRTRLGTIGALPPMPTTFAALQKVLADPNGDSRQVAAIIERDPAVSAKVLQICNSAFFRLPRRVSSIQQAVSYLGLSSVRSIVLSSEVFRPGKELAPGLELSQLQTHALKVAALARSVAADTTFAEDAFLAGLLHDVGWLLLGRHFPQEVQRALQAVTLGMPLAEAEQEFLGIDHGTAGGYLLGLWGLPYEIVEAVAHHDDPSTIVQSNLDVLGAVAIAHSLLATVRPTDVPVFETATPQLDDAYLRSVGLTESWDTLVEQADALLNGKEAA